MPTPRKAPRILITRLSAIGDCIHSLPIVAAIRCSFPDAFIGWVTQSGPASLITGTPGLDEVISVDRNWMKKWRTIRETRRRLREFRFDTVIDPQSLTKSSLLGWLSGARTRIGFARGQGRELAPLLNNQRVKPVRAHVVERYLELLRPLGVRDPQVTFPLPSFPESAETVEGFLGGRSLGRFGLLNPGAGWNSKLWPHERYAEVADYLHREHSIRSIVLWAGNREKAWAESITHASRAAVLAPDTSLIELGELCRRAEIFVGSDTGPMHLAAAVGTTCVAMFGPTLPSVCGPWGEKHIPLQARYQDGSSKERRGDDNSAMREINVASVCAACDQILSAGLAGAA